MYFQGGRYASDLRSQPHLVSRNELHTTSQLTSAAVHGTSHINEAAMTVRVWARSMVWRSGTVRETKMYFIAAVGRAEEVHG